MICQERNSIIGCIWVPVYKNRLRFLAGGEASDTTAEKELVSKGLNGKAVDGNGGSHINLRHAAGPRNTPSLLPVEGLASGSSMFEAKSNLFSRL